jgi:hypothetical protein
MRFHPTAKFQIQSLDNSNEDRGRNGTREAYLRGLPFYPLNNLPTIERSAGFTAVTMKNAVF